MTILITVISLLLISIFTASVIIWRVHLSMTMENTKQWSPGNFKKFMTQWNSHDMKQEYCEFCGGDIQVFLLKPYKFFDRLTNSQYHASIIEFDGVGMTLGYFDYFRSVLFTNQIIKKNK